MLEISSLDELEQAKVAVDWVDRRILLHQHGQDGLPAAYVLRAGYGGPGDRAAAMLAMLQQMRIDGCVLALPGATEPSLVAVLVKKDAYLFDPRTGRPVPGPDGSIATWKQLRDRPQLGEFVDLGPKAVARLETRFMVPHESLSPRMKYVEGLLQGEETHVGGERIGLYIDVVALDRARAEAGLPEAKLWNPGPDVGPLYALRRLLPAEEGGRDTAKRLQRFTLNLVPMGPVYAQYGKLGLLGDLNNAVDRMKLDELLKVTATLFDLYYAQPQEMLVRGKTESMPRRLDRILTMVADAEMADANNEKGLQQAAATWRKRANDAFVLIVRNDPAGPEKVAKLWNEESLIYLLDPRLEGAPRAKEQQILTRLILSAIREPMTEQANFLLAGLSQDRAEKAEAGREPAAAAEEGREGRRAECRDRLEKTLAAAGRGISIAATSAPRRSRLSSTRSARVPATPRRCCRRSNICISSSIVTPAPGCSSRERRNDSAST